MYDFVRITMEKDTFAQSVTPVIAGCVTIPIAVSIHLVHRPEPFGMLRGRASRIRCNR
jgi:hypothetical protein